MSISWSRIFPNGDDAQPNEEGLAFYDAVFDECHKNGMEPLVTLCHFDTPMHLAEEYNGFASRHTVDAFVRYAETVFERYKGIMKESAPVANYTNELMATRFSDVMWLIEQIMWKSLDKRVASFLLEETSIEGTNELKITHETIANHLGSHREVITRMLRYFQGEDLVKLSRGKITILDSKRLETLQRS